MKLQKILWYYYYLDLDVLLIKAYIHLIEFILFMLLELRSGLVPGGERFHEVKWNAVLGQTKGRCNMQFCGSCKTCRKTAGKVSIRKVVMVGYFSNVQPLY